MIGRSEPRDETHPTDLLLSYLEDKLSPGKRESVSVHLAECDDCQRELDQLKETVLLLERNAKALCPEAGELYDFVNFNVDDGGRIAQHLLSCALCRSEIEGLKPLEKTHEIPEDTWLQAQQVPESRKVVARPSRWFKPLVSFSVLALASLAAAVCMIFLYPLWMSENLKRVEPEQRISMPAKPDLPASPARVIIAMSSNSWDSKIRDSGLMSPRSEKLHESDRARNVFLKSVAPDKRAEPASIKKDNARGSSNHVPRMAKIILLDNFSDPPPKLKLRFLYDCIEPGQQQKDRFAFVTPGQLEEAKEKGVLSTDSIDRFLEGLRDHFEVSHAVLINLRSEGENFDISARLLDLANGKVMQERNATGVTENQLPLQLRMVSSMPE